VNAFYLRNIECRNADVKIYTEMCGRYPQAHNDSLFYKNPEGFSKKMHYVIKILPSAALLHGAAIVFIWAFK